MKPTLESLPAISRERQHPTAIGVRVRVFPERNGLKPSQVSVNLLGKHSGVCGVGALDTPDRPVRTTPTSELPRTLISKASRAV